MNNDTIKAAEQYTNKLLLGPKASEHFLAGAEYIQAQKDEQIKELVDGLKYARRYLNPLDHDTAGIDLVINKIENGK